MDELCQEESSVWPGVATFQLPDHAYRLFLSGLLRRNLNSLGLAKLQL